MKQSAANLSGVILAGGRSTRFGRDKARLEISGKTVMERLAEILSEFPFQNLAVVTATGRGDDWPGGVRVLLDDQEGLGPIGGIATALRHLPAGILAIACDMPCVSGSMVEWLLGHYDAHADAVVPRHANGIEPLFAIYQKSFLPALEEAISRQSYALHPLFDQAKVRYVDAPERFSPECEFANINTPADYERVSKLITKTSA